MAAKQEDALIYRIARYYYLENLSQNEIAQIEQISRSKVSRLLERARANGLVNVEIKLPANPLASTLEKRLQEELGLQQAIVVPASVSESTDETEDALIRDGGQRGRRPSAQNAGERQGDWSGLGTHPVQRPRPPCPLCPPTPPKYLCRWSAT